MRTGLDPITFPGMGFLRGKHLGNYEKCLFSPIKHFQRFFFYISASYFLEMFMSIR